MIWGELCEKRLHYALGAFSGQLAGVADTNNARDAVGYLNFRPVEGLNIGGSASYGSQAFPGETLPLRTSIQTSENDEAAEAASSVFLEFEDDVELLGPRIQAAVHLAWYRRQLSFESEVQYGEATFQTPDGSSRFAAVGYHATAAWFLTGEEVSDRSIVKPLRRFDPASGDYGPGAIELFCRFSNFAIGEEVFSEGLANPDDWTRRVSTVDLGWNWYANRFVKFYFDWQLSLYDDPVLIVPETGERTKRNNLFWLRGQIFF